MQYLTRELLADHRAAADRDIAACRAGDVATKRQLGDALIKTIQTDLLFGRGDFIADLWQCVVENCHEKAARTLAAQDN